MQSLLCIPWSWELNSIVKYIKCNYCLFWVPLVAQMVKRLSTTQETWVWSLGWEDPLEKEMAIHSSTVAWKIPWTEEPGRLQSMGSQRVGHDWGTSLSISGPEKLCFLALIHGARLFPTHPYLLMTTLQSWRKVLEGQVEGSYFRVSFSNFNN